MSQVLKVEGHPDLVRDTKSKAILSTDSTALSAYKTSRERQQKINEIIGQFDTVKNDLAEIKRLLLSRN